MNFAVYVLISVHQNQLVKVTQRDIGGDSTKKTGHKSSCHAAFFYRMPYQLG